MIVVTGGAGFIGSCVVSMLNKEGIEDILVVDNVASTEKWKNLVGKTYSDYIDKTKFLDWLYNNESAKKVEIIIHIGACCSTTETDFNYLIENNYGYSQKIWEWCALNNKRVIYASSAATYGDGEFGFSDSLELIKQLKPLNGYGYTKHMFDLWALKQQSKPQQFVGLKFFNVFGPNEYHKGSMASVIYHAYNQINANGKIKLFKSYKEEYAHGEQKRDFIYIKDLTDVILFLIKNKEVSGIFNVGTGKARSFNDLAKAIFSALNMEANIEYIEMPEHLKEKYQYFTEADQENLRKAGYTKEFMTLEDSVKDYVQSFLAKDFEIL